MNVIVPHFHQHLSHRLSSRLSTGGRASAPAEFTEILVKKARMFAEKYELRGQPSTGSASAASSSGSTVASGSAKSGGEKDGGEKGNRASSSNGKASKGETKSQKRVVSLPHATAQSGATEPKSQKPSKRSRR